MEYFNDFNVGIDRYVGKSGNYLISQSLTGETIPKSEVLIYNSIRQLYYGNYLYGDNGEISNASTSSIGLDGVVRGEAYQTSFDNYEQTTLDPNKYFPIPTLDTSSVRIGVISVPSKLFGDRIQPNSIEIYNASSGSLYDDGEGRIFVYNGSNERRYVGNIVYSHGLIVLTKESYEDDPSISNKKFIDTYIESPNVSLSFKSSNTLYETQYKVTISPDEFNYSLNPTLLSGSDGSIYNFATGSYFSPYITTVGLYNDDFELLGVAKLAKPIQTSRTTDMTILINIDR